MFNLSVHFNGNLGMNQKDAHSRSSCSKQRAKIPLITLYTTRNLHLHLHEKDRNIGDIFSLWTINREEILQPGIEQASNHHSTIKFTAEISETETTFLDTTTFEGKRFLKDSVLDVRTRFKHAETFQYTHFISSHPPGVKKGFIKGEALRLFRTNSSKETFEEKSKSVTGLLCYFKKKWEMQKFLSYFACR